MWEQIADEIRTEIHSGQFEPGARLVTADLAQRWGVSRGPVREALMALEMEGIVQSTRRHGTVVGTPSAIELQEVLSVREAIELAAAKTLCTADHDVTEEDVAHLRALLIEVEAAHDRNQAIEAAKLDFAFHQSIVDLAGNSRFSIITRNMISQHVQHLQGLDMTTWPRVGWEELRRSHYALIDAIARRDLAALTAATESHYSNARKRAVMPPSSPSPGKA